MPAFGFMPEFVPLILAGTKIQTVRRTRRCVPGMTMQMFTGMRTKACRRFAEMRCALVDQVRIEPHGLTFGDKSAHPDDDGFARLDGFRDYADMLAWFQRHNREVAFIGHVHRWDPPCGGFI